VSSQPCKSGTYLHLSRETNGVESSLPPSNVVSISRRFPSAIVTGRTGIELSLSPPGHLGCRSLPSLTSRCTQVHSVTRPSCNQPALGTRPAPRAPQPDRTTTRAPAILSHVACATATTRYHVTRSGPQPNYYANRTHTLYTVKT